MRHLSVLCGVVHFVNKLVIRTKQHQYFYYSNVKNTKQTNICTTHTSNKLSKTYTFNTPALKMLRETYTFSS